MRLCSWCGVEMPEDAFYRQSNGSFLSGCKGCRRVRDAIRRRNGDREKKAAYNKRWRARNPDKAAAALRRQRLRYYGLSVEQYEQMLAAQTNCCGVCGSNEVGVPNASLYVDHDHKTGAVRGLLCHHCNSALGHAGDSVDRLMALAAYLLQTQSVLETVRDYTA